MPKLLLSLPDTGETARELTEKTISIGRTDENALQIDDKSVSSRHAELTRNATGGYALRDLGSTNGTFVNGEPLQGERSLNGGETLRFGSIDALYQSESQPALDHPPLAEASTPAAAVAQTATKSHRPADFGSVAPFRKKQATAQGGDTAASLAFFIGLAAFALSLAAIFGS